MEERGREGDREGKREKLREDMREREKEGVKCMGGKGSFSVFRRLLLPMKFLKPVVP